MAFWGIGVLSLELVEEPGRPRREMKLMNERGYDITLAFRDCVECVHRRDEEREALTLEFVAKVARLGNAVDCGRWRAAGGGRGRGRGRYASAIASSNIAATPASNSERSG